MDNKMHNNIMDSIFIFILWRVIFSYLETDIGKSWQPVKDMGVVQHQ